MRGEVAPPNLLCLRVCVCPKRPEKRRAAAKEAVEAAAAKQAAKEAKKKQAKARRPCTFFARTGSCALAEKCP